MTITKLVPIEINYYSDVYPLLLLVNIEVNELR